MKKIHAIFECQDCGSQFQDWKTAQKLARQHAYKYGHIVRGEIGYVSTYDGRAERSKSVS